MPSRQFDGMNGAVTLHMTLPGEELAGFQLSCVRDGEAAEVDLHFAAVKALLHTLSTYVEQYEAAQNRVREGHVAFLSTLDFRRLPLEVLEDMTRRAKDYVTPVRDGEV